MEVICRTRDVVHTHTTHVRVSVSVKKVRAAAGKAVYAVLYSGQSTAATDQMDGV